MLERRKTIADSLAKIRSASLPNATFDVGSQENTSRNIRSTPESIQRALHANDDGLLELQQNIPSSHMDTRRSYGQVGKISTNFN